MNGVERRGFQGEMTLKYCQGRARLAQTVFGWGREKYRVRVRGKNNRDNLCGITISL
ncbi:hypothetical protein RintRC_2846 [Richelia intracellularis]|nr:hypothetical protein RintRC_2846 [Richelia intracellularis]